MKLLTHFEIRPKRVVSYHQHNRAARARDFLRWWEEGKSIALVSDAGTPAISDPGEDAVQLAVQAGVPVVPVPGPSAVLAALVASGLPAQPFSFLGFLPRDRKGALAVLDKYAGTPGSLVLYEAPHRLRQTLALLSDQFPDREAVLAKELTKRHESFIAGSLSELLEHMATTEPRGEYVIVIGPPVQTAKTETDTDETRLEAAVRMVAAQMAKGASHAEAVKEAVAATGAKKKAVYQATLANRMPDCD